LYLSITYHQEKLLQRESQKGRYKLIYVKNKEKRITRGHKTLRG